MSGVVKVGVVNVAQSVKRYVGYSGLGPSEIYEPMKGKIRMKKLKENGERRWYSLSGGCFLNSNSVPD